MDAWAWAGLSSFFPFFSVCSSSCMHPSKDLATVQRLDCQWTMNGSRLENALCAPLRGHSFIGQSSHSFLYFSFHSPLVDNKFLFLFKLCEMSTMVRKEKLKKKWSVSALAPYGPSHKEIDETGSYWAIKGARARFLQVPYLFILNSGPIIFLLSLYYCGPEYKNKKKRTCTPPLL